jgi:DNA-binding NtrC family response regulator
MTPSEGVPVFVGGDGSGGAIEDTRRNEESAAIARRPLKVLLPDGRELCVDRPLRVGSSSSLGNDVVLRDSRVSRRHCLIEVAPDGRVFVRDLSSTNGTFVNGSRVTAAEVRVGAVLCVGRSQLRFVAQERSPTIVGDSPAIRALRREIAAVAGSRLSVLVSGETGSGKELVAQALHDQSGRRGPCVAVNCGAIARELVESELFGHERGAFTGATARHAGLFEQAQGGTLFLDEIGELPLELQSRLLRVLETGLVRPVGGSREQPIDVRIVAATHVDLKAAVRAGAFREDLFYRIVQQEIRVPPLRARKEDIPLLARKFLDELGAQGGASTLSRLALDKLVAHDWPGNVRELRHALQRAAILAGPLIEPTDLALEAAGPRRTAVATHEELLAIAGRTFEELERDIIASALRRTGGNRRQAALDLGIPKSTLCDKVKRFGLAIPTARKLEP